MLIGKQNCSKHQRNVKIVLCWYLNQKTLTMNCEAKETIMMCARVCVCVCVRACTQACAYMISGATRSAQEALTLLLTQESKKISRRHTLEAQGVPSRQNFRSGTEKISKLSPVIPWLVCPTGAV